MIGIGCPLTEAFAPLAPEPKVPGRVATYPRDFWGRPRSGAQLWPGGASLLRHLARHVPGWDCQPTVRAGIFDFLGHLNLGDSVAVVVAVDDVARSKPDPEPGLAALSSLF